MIYGPAWLAMACRARAGQVRGSAGAPMARSRYGWHGPVVLTWVCCGSVRVANGLLVWPGMGGLAWLAMSCRGKVANGQDLSDCFGSRR
jgi:hypothetical protein